VDGAASREDMRVTLGPGIGGVARIVAAHDAVRTLVEELQVETERRMQLERVLGRSEVDDDGRVIPPEPLTPPSTIKSTTVATEATSEVVKVDVATSPICLSPSQAVQVTETPSEDLMSLGRSPAEPPVVSPQTELAPFEHTPTTVATLHQPTPRSTIGSPVFLSPRSSPSLSPVSIPVNTDSTIPGSLPLQDTTLASTTTNEPGATRVRRPDARDVWLHARFPYIRSLCGLSSKMNECRTRTKSLPSIKFSLLSLNMCATHHPAPISQCAPDVVS